MHGGAWNWAWQAGTPHRGNGRNGHGIDDETETNFGPSLHHEPWESIAPTIITIYSPSICPHKDIVTHTHTVVVYACNGWPMWTAVQMGGVSQQIGVYVWLEHS